VKKGGKVRLTKKLSQVEIKKSKEGVTGRIGLSFVAHCMDHFGINEMVKEEYGRQKRSNREIGADKKIITGVLARIAGGDRVEDVEILKADQGLVGSLGWETMVGADAYGNFLDDKRANGKNRGVNEAMVIKSMRKSDEDKFTYDNDATYFDSDKRSATYSYKKVKQYSGLIGCIAELGLINTMDFRRGHVSPQTGVLNQLRKAVAQAKAAGKKIKRFRSDSAAHQNDIFRFCDEGSIEYYISLDKNEAVKVCIRGVKENQWQPLMEKYQAQLGTEWAETVYVTNEGASMRILILRWANPDPTLFDESPLCYHVIGTNNNAIKAMDWLEVHNGRMGSIEHSNKEIKAGLGCDYAPSHAFEKNRGYFLMGVLAYNMMQIMKLFYLGQGAIRSTIKTLRYQFIHVCGKIVRTGRRFYCKIINVTQETFELFRNCKSKLIIANY
jgi:hypothetical protein